MHSSHLLSYGSSPASSPTASAISFDSSSTGSITIPADDDRPPDSVPALRFGDIPVVAYPAGTPGSHGPPFVLAPAEMSPMASPEVRPFKKQLSKRSTSPPVGGQSGRDLEMLCIDAFAAMHNDNFCRGANASCMVSSPGFSEALLAIQKYLPSNEVEDEEEEIWSGYDSWPHLDVYSCDDFRMYEFKVRKCVRGRSHDWTECPFAHPGEKARRRDPRRYHYSGTACPEFRKGNCRKGEACEYSHGVFECWLHPMRYRTQPCKDGKSCRRRICFFAHTPDQLRVVLSESESPPVTPRSGSSSSGSTRSSLLKAAALSGEAYDGSPLRRALAGTLEGSMGLELLLDDIHSKSSPAGCHRHHYWIGTGSPPTSTFESLPEACSSPSLMSSQMRSPASSHTSSPSSWIGAPAHRRHLDRLRSIPTISIPAAEDRCCDSLPQRSPCTMAGLVPTFQSLQLSPGMMAVQSCRTLPPCSSAWPILSARQQLASRSAPSTPKSRYLQGSGVQMEQTLTAASHLVQASSNEVSVDSDIPDLDWVKDLVQ